MLSPVARNIAIIEAKAAIYCTPMMVELIAVLAFNITICAIVATLADGVTVVNRLDVDSDAECPAVAAASDLETGLRATCQSHNCHYGERLGRERRVHSDLSVNQE
jgi:hypothetical protein